MAHDFTPWIRTAQPLHWTDLALRLARDADGCAEVHQRLVEIEDVLPRDERLRDRPQVFLHRVRFRIASEHEHAKQDPRDVGIDNRGALAEREAADGAGCVRADALER